MPNAGASAQLTSCTGVVVNGLKVLSDVVPPSRVRVVTSMLLTSAIASWLNTFHIWNWKKSSDVDRFGSR